ncbi:hypothetical protein [Aeromonas simiae]|uniref:hypothetical protein n=1 Tax=Aeromonas simiae TaxID=218936 RepID=UPI00266D8902|nr:hypothetical protein [Aeromonas simiae]MDO2948283.1 hypothetical protein [Aeromonas simiae]MDO2952980.1 hypothetical protein [Aeromonas simiae]MDO2955666.1 hypothetical protein [Aeromonas simiae]
MNPKIRARHARLKAVLASGEELRIGDERDCPLPLEQLQDLDAGHPMVRAVHGGGLTADVLHLDIDGHEWCLKRARPISRVANVDGETAFLTELERRSEIESLREHHPGALPQVVCTWFGSLRMGLLLSPWLPGRPIQRISERNLSQMLNAEAELARWGFFDWDPSPGNLLDDGQQVRLFDFGYMWPFDPLHEFNSNGLCDPDFHVPERLETRTLSGLWLGMDDPLPQFQLWRELCLEWAREELASLSRRGASPAVLERLERLRDRWRAALAGPEALWANWLQDMYRSHQLDVQDDLSGQSATPLTLKRLDWIEQYLERDFHLLQEHLCAADAGLSREQLRARYRDLRRRVEACQLYPDD